MLKPHKSRFGLVCPPLGPRQLLRLGVYLYRFWKLTELFKDSPQPNIDSSIFRFFLACVFVTHQRPVVVPLPKVLVANLDVVSA